MGKGYAPIPRIICDYPGWQKKPFCKGKALADLFLRATHDEQRVNGVKLVRGQIFITLKGLSKEWGWSRDKTRRFLADLERKKGEAWAIEQEIITPATVNPLDNPRIIGRRITFIYYNEVCGEPPKWTDTPFPSVGGKKTDPNPTPQPDTPFPSVAQLKTDPPNKAGTNMYKNPQRAKMKGTMGLEVLGFNGDRERGFISDSTHEQ